MIFLLAAVLYHNRLNFQNKFTTMTKVLPILLSILLTLQSPFLFGQITIESSDLTSVGDVITRYIDTIPTYGPGGAGANQVWDFSAAVREDTAITTVLATSATPYNSTFANSTYAMKGDAASYLYFTHTSSNLFTDGAAGDLLGDGQIIETPFTDDLVLHVFPRQFGNYFNDTYGFEAEADGAAFNVYRIRLIQSGHVYDTTDAYGTLITPTGTYDALRVKSTDFSNTIIEVQLNQFLPFWTPFSNTTDTTISYSWHAKEEKLAIAEFSYDSIGNPRQFVFSAVPPVTTVGVADAEKENNIQVYPQPATDQLFIKGLNQSSNHLAQVYSVDGKMVRNETIYENRLSVLGLQSGMYVLRITTSDGRHQEALKFIVQ